MVRKEFIDVVTSTGMATLKELRKLTLNKDEDYVAELELLDIAHFDENKFAKVVSEKFGITYIDLKNAKVFVTTNSLHGNKLFIDELNYKSKLIQRKIASNLTSKFTPKIKFFFDNSFEYSNKINNILETIK